MANYGNLQRRNCDQTLAAPPNDKIFHDLVPLIEQWSIEEYW